MLGICWSNPCHRSRGRSKTSRKVMSKRWRPTSKQGWWCTEKPLRWRLCDHWRPCWRASEGRITNSNKGIYPTSSPPANLNEFCRMHFPQHSPRLASTSIVFWPLTCYMKWNLECGRHSWCISSQCSMHLALKKLTSLMKGIGRRVQVDSWLMMNQVSNGPGIWWWNTPFWREHFWYETACRPWPWGHTSGILAF
jgi:hypothetical protein